MTTTNGDVVVALPYCVNLIKTKQFNTLVPNESVAMALAMHFVGDIHQPLHTTGRYDPETHKQDDAGGNGLGLANFVDTPWPPNLHTFWDEAYRRVLRSRRRQRHAPPERSRRARMPRIEGVDDAPRPGQEWKTNQIAIKQRNNWSVQSNGIGATMTGRKEGKSTAMAMTVINTMFNVPSVEIALFSRTKPQACIILDMAKVLGINHKRASQFKIEGFRNSIRITHIASNNIRLCTAWSGDADVGALTPPRSGGCGQAGAGGCWGLVVACFCLLEGRLQVFSLCVVWAGSCDFFSLTARNRATSGAGRRCARRTG